MPGGKPGGLIKHCRYNDGSFDLPKLGSTSFQPFDRPSIAADLGPGTHVGLRPELEFHNPCTPCPPLYL